MTPEEMLGIKEKATEKTLQSIDSTLKRIEVILLKMQSDEKPLSQITQEVVEQCGEELLRRHEPISFHLSKQTLSSVIKPSRSQLHSDT